MKPSVVRILCVAAVVVASALAIFFSISYVAIPLFVWLSPSLNPTLYDWGFYGACPLQTFVSSDLVVPRVSTARSHSDCDNGFVFLTVGGASTGPTGPTILNSDNELVWKSESYAVTTNLQVQRYKGQDYLTFWSGKKLGTKGVGVYYLVSHLVLRCSRDIDSWRNSARCFLQRGTPSFSCRRRPTRRPA
jgi:hypothetical protein